MAVLSILLGSGCATVPYQYGRFHPQDAGGVALQPVTVDYGKPNKTLDRIGWVVGIPARILTFNMKTSNHHISPKTVERLNTYLAENDITDVYVAVNDYDPKGQWRRLRENDRIAAGWRYTIGALTCLQYTAFPNRIFGGDRYNPYTNSLNLSSDVPALVLAEAAYAKDIHSRSYPGTYAAVVNDLPVLSVWRLARATNDVLGYARMEQDWKTEKQAYYVLYARLGSATVGTAGPLVPVFGPLLGIGGALAGHATGRVVAYAQRPKAPTAEVSPPVGTNPTTTEMAKTSSPSSTAEPESSPKNQDDVVPAGHAEPHGADFNP
jgi:hypothetical protein